MPRIHVTDQDGSQASINAEVGLSLMEVLRDEGYDGIQALCGGNCSCATCHVYVDEDWLDRLPAREEEEAELLGDSDHEQAGSRLSCQIEVTEALDGLAITIAPDD
ncbi:MAG: 2Fe-2S iron-sulfur cluster-binding protein [Rhodothalassiaceae bacterium]